jgi:3-hydroxybutyryl-CoA dehydratase
MTHRDSFIVRCENESERADKRAEHMEHGYFIEDIEPGMTAMFGKTITEADILMFAGVSGDTNPVHLNEEFAFGTPFKGRIAHGMLTASLISTVLGTKLPGPGCVYVSQTMRFLAPVRVGETVRAVVTVKEVNREKRRVYLETVCRVGDRDVLAGEAVLLVSRRPQAEAPAA